jgi:hypothetical protein
VPPDPSEGEVGGTPEASSRRIVAVRLTAVAGSGVQGLATVTDVAGSASVQLVVEGAEGGETAAIFEGSCDGLPAEPVVALTGLERGRSRTLLDRPTGDLLSGEFVLAVFAGEGTGRTVVACGEIPG